jgi:hypothetical protein
MGIAFSSNYFCEAIPIRQEGGGKREEQNTERL